jgi:hypothetical protein
VRGEESETRRLDNGVDSEGGAGFTLAVGAVAAVGYDGWGGNLIPDALACAATGERVGC